MGDAMRTAQCRRLFYFGFGLAILAVAAFCSAQESSEGNLSLGDLARQIQAKRAQEKSHPSRVYTNDDFPLHSSSVNNETAQSGSVSTAKPSESQNYPPLVKSDEATPGHDETYYRAKVRQLTMKLAADQKSLRDTLRIIRQTWDPAGSYTGEETPADKFINYVPYHLDEPYQYQKLRAIKDSITVDKNAISALEEQCRRDGCPPDWLR